MKGIEVKPEVDVQIDLDITSYIPDSYIEDSSEKIDIYQKIALCRTAGDKKENQQLQHQGSPPDDPNHQPGKQTQRSETAHGAERDDQAQGQGADQRNRKQLQRLQEALVQGSNDG